ncbi:hypothetical protein ACFQL8_09150 [Streptomyces goshikiensis]|uniref:hypothetical protein n=1 Tax=Streptomyces goshikiensis TaxID=1942 RepID=UPI001674D831|nr:hypothetical protein [Streptomyces goshikiensis]
MGGIEDKRQEPGKGREEQQRLRRPGQDPVHPETAQPSRYRSGEASERKRRREEDPVRDERDLREEDS